MPKPTPTTETVSNRHLAAEWRVNREWLAGVVAGLEHAGKLQTERGKRNELRVARKDLETIKAAVQAANRSTG